MRLILASSSPRRADLLRAGGFAFDVVAPEIDERLHPNEDPHAYVVRLSIAKAAAVSRPGCVTLAADTSVVVNGEILSKPADRADAARMLTQLAGRTHDVLTGVTIRNGDRHISVCERTAVTMAPITAGELDWYLESGEWEGKAGAYAIQGYASRFVEAIDGSYSNVVGLPVARVYQLLKDVAG